ncbi:MAG: hypothetical protein ABSG14_07385 [Verrucomicrobiia bacterium]|jgi:hypothetical protein
MIPTCTEVWVECDFCGRAVGGPGLDLYLKHVGPFNVCLWCYQSDQNVRQRVDGYLTDRVHAWQTSAVGMGDG